MSLELSVLVNFLFSAFEDRFVFSSWLRMKSDPPEDRSVNWTVRGDKPISGSAIKSAINGSPTVI